MSHPGQNASLILLDFHPAAPAVAGLAATEFLPEKVEIHRQIGRKSANDDHERRPVGLSCRLKLKHAGEYN